MIPVLFSVGELDISSYGASKALAALVAGWLLAHLLRRAGRDPELAWPLTIAGLAGGFAGAKLYYLAEHAGSLTAHDFGTMGFTWYGGLIGGAATVAVVARVKRLPLRELAGLVPVPLSVAYGIGRLGCLLAGDGTYGGPTDLPWAMSFPHGMVPTTQAVHPTPLYEAIAAFALAGLLWSLRTRLGPVALLAFYALLSGAARFAVEFVRLNQPVFAGLTQPQLWSLALVAAAAVVLVAATAGRATVPWPVRLWP
jgi:phosphatidylglycerol:prolipoprotein diacylglycerol transferase